MTYPDATSLYVQYDYDLTGAMIAVREKGAATGLGVLATYSYNDLGQRVSVARTEQERRRATPTTIRPGTCRRSSTISTGRRRRTI